MIYPTLRANLREDISTDHAKQAYSFIREKQYSSLSVIMLQDLNEPIYDATKPWFTTKNREMHQEFVAQWRTVFNVHDGKDQKQMVEQYMQKYGAFIPNVPLKFDNLTGHDLQTALLDRS